MKKAILRSYAQLLAQKGLNVQPGQDVLITAELDQPDFVTMCVEECYKLGARSVIVDWTHQPATKLHCDYRSLETQSKLEDWQLARWQWQVDNRPAKLFIESEDPDGLAGVDQEKHSKATAAVRAAIKPYRNQMDNHYQWCIAAVPGKAWAKKMFPALPDDEAVLRLWDAILSTSRAADGNGVENWNKHNADLVERYNYLNSLGIRSLRYSSSNGTDFTVGMIENALFSGGKETTIEGIEFNPNIPSEEIFISPKAGEAEGILYATKPLSWNGALIENFWVKFADGHVVDVGAKKNEELLRKMVAMDEGASRLGEVALVPFNSPINNTGLLFYNTLFDENACCHVALGFGFGNCLKGYETMTIEEMHAAGINDSIIHVDFMIGSRDLNIVATTANGKEVEIFRDGNWA